MSKALVLFRRVYSGLCSLFHMGAAYWLVSTVFAQGSVYLIQFIGAKLLVPADFGVLRVIDSGLNIALRVAGLGMPVVIVKCVAESGENRDQVRQVLTYSTIIAVVSAVMTALVLRVILSGGIWEVDDYTRVLFSRLVWILVFAVLTRLSLGFYQGRKQILRAAVANTVLSLVALTATTGLMLLEGIDGWAIGRLGTEVLFAVSLVVSVRGWFAVPRDRHVLSNLLRLGWPTVFSNFVVVLSAELGTIMLASLTQDAAQVAFFGIAAMCRMVVMLISAAIAAVALPYVSVHSKDFSAAFSFWKPITLRALLLICALSAAVFVVAPTAIPLVLGADYRVSVALTQALMLAAVFGSVWQMTNFFLLAVDRPVGSLVANLIGVALAVLLNVMLIPTIGVWGAVVSEVISYFVRGVLQLLLIFHLRYESQSL